MLYAYHEKRNKRAVRILLDEVRRGGSDITEVATQDEVVGVIYRYAIAVRDNVALANLRLLAQVIRGLASQRALYADRFDRYAVCLSSLTRDEVIVLGTLHKIKIDAATELERDVPASQYWSAFIDKLVPSTYKSETFVRAIVGGIARTGLVVTDINFSGIGLYTTSPLMDEVYELTDFEAALREEDGLGDDPGGREG